MKHKQNGITMIGFLITLALAGFLIYCGMKVVPMYSEFYAVKAALKGIAEDTSAGQKDPGKIKDLFFKRLYMSYAENVKPENLTISRSENGYLATVDYEVRKPLVYNLDIVGKFHAEHDIPRGSGAD